MAGTGLCDLAENNHFSTRTLIGYMVMSPDMSDHIQRRKRNITHRRCNLREFASADDLGVARQRAYEIGRGRIRRSLYKVPGGWRGAMPIARERGPKTGVQATILRFRSRLPGARPSRISDRAPDGKNAT